MSSLEQGVACVEVQASQELLEKARAARAAWPQLASALTACKDGVLLAMARRLREAATEIVATNGEDVRASVDQGASRAMIDRLTLTEGRVEAMARSLEEVAALRDPLGEGEAWVRPNGLHIARVRVPLGVIGIIYEARPNVTVEAASLAFKAGNAVLLRGSSTALASNRILVRLMQEALVAGGLSGHLVGLVEDVRREVIDQMVRLNGLLDVVVPRGGDALIRRVVGSATVPVIETGVGNCHVYVDARADLEKACRIVVNAKTQRPAVCNAAESLLVHSDVAERFLPVAGAELRRLGVELRACPRAAALLEGATAAGEEDWGREFLDLILAVRVVDSLDAAIDHIRRHGTRHSEAIVTEDYSSARRFVQEIDAAAVYVNASTRFTDGGEFGFGGEMGISTQKLHARGPMGVRELTTSKYVVTGDGQVRE